MKINNKSPYLEYRKYILKALRDGAELFVDATEFCSQLDW